MAHVVGFQPLSDPTDGKRCHFVMCSECKKLMWTTQLYIDEHGNITCPFMCRICGAVAYGELSAEDIQEIAAKVAQGKVPEGSEAVNSVDSDTRTTGFYL